jgi:hypothetical protein
MTSSAPAATRRWPGSPTGSRTEAEAYMRVAAERYRLIKVHEWNEEIIDRLRRTIR